MNKSRFIGFVFICLIIFFSTNSHATTITYELIVNPSVLAGRITGQVGDIFFEGGAKDANLTDFPCCPPGTLGLNTIGSTGFSTFYDDFINFNVLSQSYIDSSWEVGAGLIFFDENVNTGYMAQAETLFVADGLLPGIETISNIAPSIVTVNPDNTQSFLTFTENDDFVFTDTSIASYYLLAGQDPNVVFSDPSIFDVADFNGEVTQQGVIDHFNYLISDVVAPGWTALSYSYWVIEADAKPTSSFNDAVGLGIASFVSYDAAASTVYVSEVAELLASDGASGDFFGFSVAVRAGIRR